MRHRYSVIKSIFGDLTPEEKLPCGHGISNWRSICSAHFKGKEDCPRCNVGRCIKCVPEIPIGSRFLTFDKKTGKQVNAFPNLGPRLK